MKRFTVTVTESRDIMLDIHAETPEQARKLAETLVENGCMDENANEVTGKYISEGGIVEWPPMGEPADYNATEAKLEAQPTADETAAWLAKVRRCIEDTSGDVDNENDALTDAGHVITNA